MDSEFFSLITRNSRHQGQFDVNLINVTKPNPGGKEEVLGTRLINPLCVTLGLAYMFGLFLAQDWGYCLNDHECLLFNN